MISADPLRTAGRSRLGDGRQPAAYNIAFSATMHNLQGALILEIVPDQMLLSLSEGGL